jgi:hypothetical protein
MSDPRPSPWPRDEARPDHVPTAPSPTEGGGALGARPGRRLLFGLLALASLLLALDFVVDRHVYFPVEERFGFNTLFALVGCVSMAILAVVLRTLVMRPEDHDGA